MIDCVSVNDMKDRNGCFLYYGDIVLAKVWISYQFTPCQIVGFTNKYVVLIPLGNSSTCCYRKSNNVVKINNYKTWKLNF